MSAPWHLCIPCQRYVQPASVFAGRIEEEKPEAIYCPLCGEPIWERRDYRVVTTEYKSRGLMTADPGPRAKGSTTAMLTHGERRSK